MRARLNQQGFALPTILISSVVMLIVLTSAVSAAASVRSAISSQFYTQLAREASESGLMMARACLMDNLYTAQWSSSSQLRPSTTCSGGTCSGQNCYLVKNDDPNANFADLTYRSTFSVRGSIARGASQHIISDGTVELLRPDGSVARTYGASLTMRIGNSASLGEIPPIIFGQ